MTSVPELQVMRSSRPCLGRAYLELLGAYVDAHAVSDMVGHSVCCSVLV